MKVLGGVFSLLIAIWIAWFLQFYIFDAVGVEWDVEKIGSWGDTFGALNALFAALGFSAVLITLWYQQRQINEASEDQHRQQFDRTFFQLLGLLREARGDVSYRYSASYREKLDVQNSTTKIGADAFKEAAFEARFWIEKEMKIDSKMSKEDVGKLYTTKIHSRNESRFSPYFRMLYTILTKIKYDYILTDKEKHFYGNLVRSQMTSFESFIAGLNGLSSVSKDFSDLVTEFRLLKYIPNGARKKILFKFYKEEAFLARD